MQSFFLSTTENAHALLFIYLFHKYKMKEYLIILIRASYLVNCCIFMDAAIRMSLANIKHDSENYHIYFIKRILP